MSTPKPAIVVKFSDDEDVAIILALRGLIESAAGLPFNLTEVTRVALREALENRTGGKVASDA